MFVTIVYHYPFELNGNSYELQPYSQYDLVDTIVKPGYNYAGDYRNINYYKFEFDEEIIEVPETHAILEANLREGKDTRPDYIYDKYTGKLSQPRDWIQDFIDRTGNDIRKNMKPRHNGENIQLPKKGGSESIDPGKQSDSGDQIHEV